MDQIKTGALIRRLRQEQGLTQKQLAERLTLSDRTISKWERGAGCPDISLLREVARTLQVDVEALLSGVLEAPGRKGGTMTRIQFFVCPVCGAVIQSTGAAEVSCCGRRLTPLTAQEADTAHTPAVELVEDEFYLAFPHEMTKDHFLRFVAAVSYDRALLVQLYPEQNAALRLPALRRTTLYVCCSRHGLYRVPQKL